VKECSMECPLLEHFHCPQSQILHGINWWHLPNWRLYHLQLQSHHHACPNMVKEGLSPQNPIVALLQFRPRSSKRCTFSPAWMQVKWCFSPSAEPLTRGQPSSATDAYFFFPSCIKPVLLLLASVTIQVGKPMLNSKNCNRHQKQVF